MYDIIKRKERNLVRTMITVKQFSEILDATEIDSVILKDIEVEGKIYPAIINEPESKITLLEKVKENYVPSVLISLHRGYVKTEPCKVETF